LANALQRPPPLWRYDHNRAPLLAGSVAVAATPGFFASQTEQPGPYNRLRPYWRYRSALLAAARTGAATYDLTASGAAVSSGTGTLFIVLLLSANGAQTSTGSADLLVVMLLGATGATTSSGSGVLGVVMLLAASGAQASTGSALIAFPAPAGPSKRMWLGTIESAWSMRAGGIITDPPELATAAPEVVAVGAVEET
jgi:hypothetical protein